MRCFDDKEVISLLQIYSSKKYNPRGAPDLYVFNPKTRAKQFIEVKSYRDSLRYDQLLIASSIIDFVGNYFTIAYVLPSNYDELQEKEFKEAFDLIAKQKHFKR